MLLWNQLQIVNYKRAVLKFLGKKYLYKKVALELCWILKFTIFCSDPDVNLYGWSKLFSSVFESVPEKELHAASASDRLPLGKNNNICKIFQLFTIKLIKTNILLYLGTVQVRITSFKLYFKMNRLYLTFSLRYTYYLTL